MTGPRWPLSRKILLLALLNLALLAGMLAGFVRAQFRAGPESLLLEPARDRVQGIAAGFSLQFQAAAPDARAALLDEYRKQYGADFFLIGGRGGTLAGPEIEAPQEILDGARRVLPPPERRGPPPPRDGPEGNGPPPDGPPRRRAPLPRESVFLLITHSPVRYWAGARIETGGFDGEPGTLAILLIRSDSIFQNRLFFNWPLWLGVGLSIVAVTVACWLPFIRGMTRAIARMDCATRQIAEGRFDVAVAGGRRDELGDLGEQIDRMAARLHSFVSNQKRFLGDIAHELCAPIARIQFALGILEQKAEDAQRQHVAALHEEIQEMSALVNELLSFSKAGMSAGSVTLEPVAVADAARRAAAREGFAGTPIEVAAEDGLAAMANDGLLLRALSNLLRNAVRYAGVAGPVAVTARRVGGQVEIVVADSGPGLPEEELENVFAPFYRPEEARTRETGGAGLGLAIVRTCVEACGGTVACRNRKPSGLEVVIRLDVAQANGLRA
jgi:two-component system, OmpR family, sensor histidine kinase CpxA